MGYLSIENIYKQYSGKVVLNDICFSIDKGEFVSVLGPSGCGKTTLLSILIGLTQPDKGKIIKDGIDITSLPSSKRKMGIVFQNYALFPYMSVLKNVEYALSIHKETKHIARETAINILTKMGLQDHLNKKPNKLSGGQQQRVAIARTLALNPDIILFDEPMSALDVTTRLMLRDELKEIQNEYGVTMIYITHDQEEAFTLSDRVIIMSEGNIEQFDAPENIISKPVNQYVEDFVICQIEKKIDALAKIYKNVESVKK